MSKSITVRLFPGMSELAGTNMLSLNTGAATVRDLLRHLENDFGSEFLSWMFDKQLDLRDGVFISLNDTGIGNLKGMDTPLADGDRISILLPVVGG